MLSFLSLLSHQKGAQDHTARSFVTFDIRAKVPRWSNLDETWRSDASSYSDLTFETLYRLALWAGVI